VFVAVPDTPAGPVGPVYPVPSPPVQLPPQIVLQKQQITCCAAIYDCESAANALRALSLVKALACILSLYVEE